MVESESAKCSGGTCEPTGFCSYVDGSCTSGRRYSELAGSGLKNRCVGETDADAGLSIPEGAPRLASLGISSPITEASTFNPGLADYHVQVSLLAREIRLTPKSAGVDVTIEIEGENVATTTESMPITLDLGTTIIEVRLTDASNIMSTYFLHVNRANRAIGQTLYAKGSNSFALAKFGSSVAISGDTMVIGATNYSMDGVPSGAVYVYQRTEGLWQQAAVLKADNFGDGDQFGSSVALLGDLLAVGAPLEDGGIGGIKDTPTIDETESESGAVYLFRRDAGGMWLQEAYVKETSPIATDQFGSSVALAMNMLVVGAPGVNSVTATNSGAAFVFVRSDGQWRQQAIALAAAVPAQDEEFGFSIALAGDWLAVGAPGNASAATGVGATPGEPTASRSGAVHLFRRGEGESWESDLFIKASNTDANDRFGTSVALTADSLLVGSPGEGSNSSGVNPDSGQADNTSALSGAAYAFGYAGESWSQIAYVKASNGTESDQFGFSVALADDRMVVGARGEDSQEQRSGAVYPFRFMSNAWVAEAAIKASNPDSGDEFGLSVAISADTLVIGAPDEASNATGIGPSLDQANNSAESSGAVYLFQ